MKIGVKFFAAIFVLMFIASGCMRAISRELRVQVEEEITIQQVRKSSEAFQGKMESLEKGDSFDLITLDIIMPDMDGLRALKKIRGVEKEVLTKKGSGQDRVKIMMVTSHSNKSLVLRCARAGCNNYIVKPFTKDKIIEKLEELGFAI